MTRIQPKSSTIKKLFALSGNQCVNPECKSKIVEGNVILGEICHIEAAEEGGPRFNLKSNDEYRRSLPNLLLLCEKCHKKIDAKENEKIYTAPLISSWKEEHERKFQDFSFDVSDELVTKSIEQFMTQNNINTSSGTQINNQAQIQNIGTQIGTQVIHNHEKTQPDGNKLIVDGYRNVDREMKMVIDKFRTQANPPKKAVIDFRNEINEGKERPIELVPLKYLKFRKDNGRIRAEVETIERAKGRELDEYTEETQAILRDILRDLNVSENEQLKRLLKHKGQREPAIITCDGFLINGNRRKLALEELFQESGQDSKFENMRVVILPEFVTEIDIQKIENRYQLQSEGKSEYHGLNRALTIRKNIEKGFELEAQLRDDPNYADLDKKAFGQAVKKIEKDFLNPLKCVDRYLETFDRKGLYNTISEGSGDKEGRWQAFIDYSTFYQTVLDNPAKRQELGIKEKEVGHIENAIFKIIRKRTLNSKELERQFGKVHAFIRSSNLTKYLRIPSAKKHLLDIAINVEDDISEDEKNDENGNRYDERDIDGFWGEKFRTDIIGSLVQARKAVEKQSERDQPIDLLEDALKKLNHKNLKIDDMGIANYDKALKLTKEIMQKADEIYQEVDRARFVSQKMTKKGKGN